MKQTWGQEGPPRLVPNPNHVVTPVNVPLPAPQCLSMKEGWSGYGIGLGKGHLALSPQATRPSSVSGKIVGATSQKGQGQGIGEDGNGREVGPRPRLAPKTKEYEV